MSGEAQTASAGFAEAVTPNDSTVIFTRGIFVGGAGNLAVTMFNGGNNVTFTGVTAGTMLPIKASKVLLTGTTATNIIRVW